MEPVQTQLIKLIVHISANMKGSDLVLPDTAC